VRFEDQVVLITGGASGIGKAAVRKFHREGARVVFADVNDALAADLAAELDSPRCRYIRADITDETQVQALVRTTVAEWGTLDVLVNNAAIFILKSIDATVSDWERMLRVNIMGQALVTKYAVEPMKRQRRGAIVNLGSISAVIAQPSQLTYNVTKAAMVEMTRCLALDLREYGIRVNAVSPGWVMTENVHNLLYRERAMTDPQIKAELGDLHLLGRLADPAEIADAIAYLASAEASFITGANLMVDGGYTAV
jgi:NAD(P)-dependent dehydrogenase (short-subunit alcohol dehydrogenase family)